MAPLRIDEPAGLRLRDGAGNGGPRYGASGPGAQRSAPLSGLGENRRPAGEKPAKNRRRRLSFSGELWYNGLT